MRGHFASRKKITQSRTNIGYGDPNQNLRKLKLWHEKSLQYKVKISKQKWEELGKSQFWWI